MLKQAVIASSVIKFNVVILPNDYNGEEEATEMSYVQLGTYLVTNADKIESVVINLKEE